MRTKVITNSSRITQLDYNEEDQVLTITFRRGGVYEYHDVPEEVYEKLANAESVGVAFGTLVRDQYETIKIS